MYTNIPNLIAIDDTTALIARLYEHLKALDIRENNNDPKHNYYIGLAYLSMIDVEVNHERAIELITSSAKQEYLPAIKQIECDVLFTFESEETGKSYIVYTDDTLDEEGNTKVYASIFDPEAEGEELKLIPIESDEEWAVIETILEQIQEDALEDDEE